jgi:hypothetical protein
MNENSRKADILLLVALLVCISSVECLRVEGNIGY